MFHIKEEYEAMYSASVQEKIDSILEDKFDAKVNRAHLIGWIRDFFSAFSNKKAVIGISGGKDSTICAALLADALGADRVVGVMMPQGEQSDIADAKRVCDMYCGTSLTIPIGGMVDAIRAEVDSTTDQLPFLSPGINPVMTTNVPPRVRMTVLYAVAAMVDGLVCNTSNRSEIYLGYSTKWGDNIGDFGLLRDFTYTELLELGKQCYIPSELILKAPADGLTGRTDEDNFGFTYFDLDNLLLNGVVPDADTMAAIKSMERRNRHKYTTISHPNIIRNSRGEEWF